MVHYALFRFKENALTDDVINAYADAYEAIAKRYDGIENPQLYRNIVTREANMDLMITLEMRGREDLQAYLDSEEHRSLIERYGDIVESQFSFDHN